MKRYHKWLHYHLSSSLMIMGIVISFICFFNSMNLYHLIEMENQDKVEYQYEHHMSAQYINMSSNTIVGDYLTADTGIVRMEDVILYRNKVDAPGLADVIVCQNEKLNYSVIKGCLPETDDDITEPSVILGRKQIQDAEYENGNYYYELENVRCKVIAVLGSENSEAFDYQVIAYYKGMETLLYDRVNSISDAHIVIESNQSDVQIVFDEMYQKTGEDVLLNAESSISVTQQGVSEDGSYYLVIFLFCLVNIVFVSEYWIKRRYREIAVRKIFGYSDRKIYGLLYKDMVINVGIAVLIAGVVQAILQICFDEYLQLYKSQFGYYLGCAIGFVFLISALILIYPFRTLQKEDMLKQMISKCK